VTVPFGKRCVVGVGGDGKRYLPRLAA